MLFISLSKSRNIFEAFLLDFDRYWVYKMTETDNRQNVIRNSAQQTREWDGVSVTADVNVQ